MAYFPFFIDIAGKEIVVVGGGKIAFRKAEKLLQFVADIKVIAPNMCDELLNLKSITKVQREYSDRDILGAFAVISATGNRKIDTDIYKLCIENHILVNTVDDTDLCEFIFPSLVCRENMTIGISTGGTVPAFSKYLRPKIEKLADENMRLCQILANARPLIHQMFQTDDERASSSAKLIEYLTESAVSDPYDLKQVLERIKTDHENQNRNQKKQTCFDTV